MFLSRSDEETTSNRKLAKDLVDKWVGWHSKLHAVNDSLLLSLLLKETYACICGLARSLSAEIN